MATVYTLNANQVPAPVVPAALLSIAAGSPSVRADSVLVLDTTDIVEPVNRNATALDVLGRAGAGAYAIDWDSNPASTTLPGLDLTVSSGLTLAIAAGQVVLDSVVQKLAPTTIALTNNIARIYLWISQNGTVTAVHNSTTPPAGAQVFLGSVVTSGGAITQIDGSGVMYFRGGTLERRTADVETPTDSPPKGLVFLNRTAGGTFLWNGLEYVSFGAGRTFLNVRDFGATGDGVTDDGPAFTACIRAAIDYTSAKKNRSIYIPAGTYLIGTNAVFSDTTASSRDGMHVFGDGMESSLLKLDTSTATWFYDNGASTPRFQKLTFSDLGFTSDDDTVGCGFKVWSAGHEKHFQWYRCRFHDLLDGFIFWGTANADVNRWYGCKIQDITHRVFTFDNAQSVCNELFGCEVGSVDADIFYIGPEGGGSLNIIGGSYVIKDPNADLAEHWILYVEPSSNFGTFNNNISFYGMRTELHGASAGLCNFDGTVGSGAVCFDNCNLARVVDGSREAVVCGTNRRVTFNRCHIPDEFTYRLSGTASSPFALRTAGHIEFKGCLVPSTLSERFTIDNTYGRASARDCTCHLSTLTDQTAVNFDYNFVNDVRGDAGGLLKSAIIRPRERTAPNSGGAERVLTLPAGSIIQNIRIHKPASGVSTSSYQMHVGNNDKTAIYGSSVLGQMQHAHTIHVEDLGIDVGTDANKRSIRHWASPNGNEGHTGGYAIVEYY